MSEPQDDATATVIPTEAPPLSEVATTSYTGRDVAGWVVLGGAAAAVLWGLLAAIGSGAGFWDWSVGLTWVHWSAYLALAICFLGIFFVTRRRKTGAKPPRLKRWLGVIVTAGYLGWLMTYVIASWSVPDIHDISTDLADPPEFRVLAIRPDNLDNVPGTKEADMKGMTPQQRWVVVHQKSYGDIRSVRINQPVADVIAKAERLAKDRDWDIAVVDPVEGRMEATEISPLFRFKEDIVLRARSTENGRGSIVDMRSVSRVGENDRGTNAKRVRDFLSNLSGTVSGER